MEISTKWKCVALAMETLLLLDVMSLICVLSRNYSLHLAISNTRIMRSKDNNKGKNYSPLAIIEY